jgi:hypothetical protein
MIKKSPERKILQGLEVYFGIFFLGMRKSCLLSNH